MKKLLGFLLGILLVFSARGAAAPPAKPNPILGATVSGHNIVFTFSETSTYSGLGFNFFFGTTSGGESSTPVNASLLTGLCSGSTCTATITATSGSGGNATSSLITPMATIYATVEACVPYGGSNVCSAPSNEVSCVIPLASSDISAPASLAGVAH